MKIAQTQNAKVESSGTGASTGFRIATNAQAFHLLSSGMYSDKIAAVLREIGCNAADAHIAAGKRDLPFEVKLPTEYDAQFWIQDWGLGLDEAGVRGLYTTYFDSTKRDSDEFTGAFGLGSKSPFSYTESFSIAACHGGRQRMFVAHVDDTGSPVITKVGECEASHDWPSGLRISFAVERKDFREFAEKSIQVYRWFHTKPTVRGLVSDWVPQESYWLDNAQLSVTSDRQYHATESYVLMGNVAYPLKTRDVYPNHGYEVDQRPEIYLTSGGMVLKLPIGAVDVAASREGLQYTERTRIALQEALAQAYETVCEEAVERFHAAWRNNVGWTREVARIAEIKVLPTCLRGSLGEVLTPRLIRAGVPPEEAYTPALYYQGRPSMPVPRWVDTDKEAGITVKFLPNYQYSKAKSYIVHHGQHEEGTDTCDTTLLFHPETKIYVGDVDKAEERTPMRGDGDALLVMQRGKDKSKAEQIARQIAHEMGGVPVIQVSSLAAPVKIQTERDTKVTVLLFNDLDPRRGSDAWLAKATSIKLDTVPVECRYFLVRDGAATSGTTLFSMDYLDEEGELCTYDKVHWPTLEGLLTRWMWVFQELGLREQVLPWGFVLVPPTAVKRLGLVEQGFKPLLPCFREVLQSSGFTRGLTSKAVDGMPTGKGVPPRPAAIFASRFLDSESGFAGALQDLLYPEVVQYLRTLKPEFRDDYEKTLRSQLEAMIGPVWEFLNLNPDVFTCWQQVEARLEKEYPALAIVSPKKMLEGEVASLLPALQCIFAPLEKPTPVRLAA